jgi:hypothetical protein
MIRRARRVEAIAVALCWIVLLGWIGWILYVSHKPLEPNPSAAKDPMTALISVAAFALAFAIFIVPLMLILTALGYVAVFVIPFLLTLPFVLPFARKWRDPVKFLVLRPFNKDRITTDLVRFLRDEFAPFGHCYTLSDRKVRVPFHIRVPLLLGQLSFFNFRVRKIRQPRQIEKLAQAMQKQVIRNLNWCFSGNKLFPIRCCDPGWRACVARLVREVDVVVADLTSVTPNVAWELQLLRDTGGLERTVFVVEESQMTEARKAIAELLGGSQTIPVLPYGPAGNSNGSAVRASVMHIVCRDPKQAAVPQVGPSVACACWG